ncbi:MAG: hypothetical protein RRC34_15855 [Lentisphaeria bacterium]|nr:hypothetical protein [Lentisphaeria bacterium]
MTDLSAKIWYGGEPATGAARHRQTAMIWFAIALGFTAARLCLPVHATDSALIHTRIIEALGHSHIWGRQALISSLEFPTFTTICLLFTNQVAQFTPFTAATLLTALSQTWAFCYLLRIPQSLKGRLITGVTLGILGMSPEFQTAFLTDDPNWAAAVPVASALYHLVRWQRDNSLRDAVVLGGACGLLVFCGPVGLVTALVFLLVSTLNIRRLPRLYDTQNMTGVPFLIWAPFGYCLVLLFLANWLIMGNPFYPLVSLAPALTPAALSALPGSIPLSLVALPRLCVGGLVIAFFSVAGRRKVAAEGVAAALIALFALGVLFADTPVFMPGLHAQQLILAVTAVLFPSLFLFEQYQTSWKRHAAMFLMAATIFVTIAVPKSWILPETQLVGSPPSVEEVISVTDFYWRDGRIAVFGMRAPGVFFDSDEKRFIKRVDFFEEDLKADTLKEQLYLLIPPDDGRFYPPASSLAHLHAEGADWLLLEKAWPSGWQLWRGLLYDPPATDDSLSLPDQSL